MYLPQFRIIDTSTSKFLKSEILAIRKKFEELKECSTRLQSEVSSLRDSELRASEIKPLVSSLSRILEIVESKVYNNTSEVQMGLPTSENMKSGSSADQKCASVLESHPTDS